MTHLIPVGTWPRPAVHRDRERNTIVVFFHTVGGEDIEVEMPYTTATFLKKDLEAVL